MKFTLLMSSFFAVSDLAHPINAGLNKLLVGIAYGLKTTGSDSGLQNRGKSMCTDPGRACVATQVKWLNDSLIEKYIPLVFQTY